MLVSGRGQTYGKYVMSALTSLVLALILLTHLQYSCFVSSATKTAKQPNTDVHSALYTMYLPERCTTSSLTGFNKGVVISQRGAKYAPDTRCTLNLRVRSSARAIRFSFEHMDLPEIRPGLCEDSVEFHTPAPDAPEYTESEDSQETVNSNSNKVIGPFCGRTLPEDFFSNGTSVVVRFTTNKFREGSGFRFRFERISYSVDLCSDKGCNDVSAHHVAQHLTASASPLLRYFCYAFVLGVAVYVLWKHPSIAWSFFGVRLKTPPSPSHRSSRLHHPTASLIPR